MRNAVHALLGDKVPPAVEEALQRVLYLDRLNDTYAQASALPPDQSFYKRLLQVLNVQPRVAAADLARIPKTGPVVVVANHPFGLIEANILAALLPSIRPDVRILANYLVGEFEALRDIHIFVDPFGGEGAVKANLRAMREALKWLKGGGMLAVFPAGEVAHLDLKKRQIVEAPWSENVARLARASDASVLPIFFDGNNSALFHLLGLIHPRLRTALLPHEYLNKHDMGIELRVGNVISPKKFVAFPDDASLIRHLRHRTYLLEGRGASKKKRPLFLRKRSHQTALQPVVEAVSPEFLAAEVSGLSDDHFLAEAGGLRAVLARAHEIPNALREIGRLREITFRQTGEGTGKSIDIDPFDAYYLHIFLWNPENREIVGAYRLGPSDEILSRFGAKGLYTNTLFAYKRAFLDRIRPALEMGRSFVRAEYQKSYAPLLLLWKGIGQFVVRHPQYKVLFGPVSISNEYNPASRQLMVTFLKSHNQSDSLASLVRARSPFQTKPLRALEGLAEDLTTVAEWDIEELSALIADIEPGQKGVPILLKQYLKLGGKLVAFNVDANFSDALDGLIVVDLAQTDPRVLDRYMGKEGTAKFLRYHAGSHNERMPA
jgi:putative hemolysin